MDDHCKRSGQIPAFGDWDYANELPITQYFECARQAGLIRFSSSSGETCDAYVRPADLYAVDHIKKPSRNVVPSRKGTTRGREKRGPRAHVAEQKKQEAKVCDVTQPPPTKPYQYRHHQRQPNHTDQYPNDTVSRPRRFPTRPPKPVDEDLYKIPPELLHTTKRKKMLGLFACLVPACAS